MSGHRRSPQAQPTDGRGQIELDAHQVFEFQVESDRFRLVVVRRRGRVIKVTEKTAADVVLDQRKATIRNAIDPVVRAFEHGVMIEWKQPMIPGWDWLTFSRQRRF